MHSHTLIRETECRRRLGGISRSTFWRLRKDGLIPSPVVIKKRNYFVAAELDAAIIRLTSPDLNKTPTMADEVTS